MSQVLVVCGLKIIYLAKLVKHYCVHGNLANHFLRGNLV